MEQINSAAASPPAPEAVPPTALPVQNPPANNPWLAKIGKFILATAWFGGIGAAAGYYASLHTPVPAQFMVLDVDGIMKAATDEAAKLGPHADAAKMTAVGDEYIAKTRAVTKRLADSGVIVIDRHSVVDFPAGSLITMETINATHSARNLSESDKP